MRAGVAYRFNPALVRGLDYYGKTVFEWTTDKLGAQATVCAGGRYDGLVEQLGGKPTPAVGFGMGIERLCLLLEACGINCRRILSMLRRSISLPPARAPKLTALVLGGIVARSIARSAV